MKDVYNQNKNIIERHVKTHSQRSDEDRSAVTILETFLRANGRISTNFSKEDKWPNTDGTLEFVENPLITRRPKQNFCVQIKGTHLYTETSDCIKYSLKSLAFPAYIYLDVTLDPGLLFVVLNPDCRGEERVFWKYMSVEFVNSLNYEHNSATLSFTPDEEIKNTNESIEAFCDKLSNIICHHTFVKQLDNRPYSRHDIEKIVRICDEQISETIDRFEISQETRDSISKRMLNRLYDLCSATLILHTIDEGFQNVTTRLAWEHSLLKLDTKYLGTFLRGLQYIGNRIPDDGQSERLMLKYYDFLWQIRKSFEERYGVSILQNLEKFPLAIDKLDYQYYQIVSEVIESTPLDPDPLGVSRFYIQKKVPFFIGKERYYELTLQLAGVYATKYNRITAYTKDNISTSYSVQIGYKDAIINLWGVNSHIKIVTNWKVSIDPSCLNKLGKILGFSLKLSSKFGEYGTLMALLTQTGINLLDMIDLQEVSFSALLDSIYKNTNTALFKDVLTKLRNNYSEKSTRVGCHVIRYLLLNLREETIEDVLPTQYGKQLRNDDNLYLSSKCLPFEKNPFISNLVGRKTSEGSAIQSVLRVAGNDSLDMVRPYLTIKNQIKQTGEIYFEESSVTNEKAIREFNDSLDRWELQQGHQIKHENGFVYIDLYEKTTISILQKLLQLSLAGNKGQREFNLNYIKQSGITFEDPLKESALRSVFVSSKIILIYGAAGTGKTTLINYISNLMAGRSKLFLTKTHTALQNLQRRIDNLGSSSDFISIDSFTKRVNLPDYDIIFVDECSTIDNRTMSIFLEKMNSSTFLVLAGDIYQIESIDFGNWFFYAKDIIKSYGANIELHNTWRTQNQALINLWNAVRNKEDLITEILAIDGPFSEDIGPNLLEREDDDEVILCLNYDGKFGLNNMNNYFQNANRNGEAISWREWTYKVGDPILFNETKRFPLLYNNLKGRIVGIVKDAKSVTFTIDIEIILTEMDCQGQDFEFVDVFEDSSRISLTVYAYDDSTSDPEDSSRMNSIVPFQLAYAVSIHKAQGLEYDSVKVIIPQSNSEKITHGIFYTAITRAKKKLKIYWSTETMKEIVSGFTINDSKGKSLEIVKAKLALTQ